MPNILSGKTQKPTKKNGASLQRLLGYMKPHAGRFTAVITLVIVSSLGRPDSTDNYYSIDYSWECEIRKYELS